MDIQFADTSSSTSFVEPTQVLESIIITTEVDSSEAPLLEQMSEGFIDPAQPTPMTEESMEINDNLQRTEEVSKSPPPMSVIVETNEEPREASKIDTLVAEGVYDPKLFDKRSMRKEVSNTKWSNFVEVVQGLLVVQAPISAMLDVSGEIQRVVTTSTRVVILPMENDTIGSRQVSDSPLAENMDQSRLCLKSGNSSNMNPLIQLVFSGIYSMFMNVDKNFKFQDPYAFRLLLMSILQWAKNLSANRHEYIGCKDTSGILVIVAEIRESLPNELDFLIEAKNNVKCLEIFRKLSPIIADYVYAPKVHWYLSTSKLLTMEFMDGAQVNDVIAIRRLGMQPSEVSRLVSQTFVEMMFKHGFVHCDPHAANSFVRPLLSDKRSNFDKKKPQLFHSPSPENPLSPHPPSGEAPTTASTACVVDTASTVGFLSVSRAKPSPPRSEIDRRSRDPTPEPPSTILGSTLYRRYPPCLSHHTSSWVRHSGAWSSLFVVIELLVLICCGVVGVGGCVRREVCGRGSLAVISVVGLSLGMWEMALLPLKRSSRVVCVAVGCVVRHRRRVLLPSFPTFVQSLISFKVTQHLQFSCNTDLFRAESFLHKKQ
ncbi:hypothetical protein GQ457_14G008310 [Hibiscus cannabinus]